MHLKDSIITTIFLTIGFPEISYQFRKWTDDEDCLENTVQIEGREEAFLWTPTIHEKYGKRPAALDNICLAEFVINYTSNSQDKKLSDSEFLQTAAELPHFVKSKDNAGVMRLRKRPCVLRLLNSKRKTENHEFIYSECLLYLP